jgi:fructose-1,6-bisphosphatase/inositol monophosphatase family enzyme
MSLNRLEQRVVSAFRNGHSLETDDLSLDQAWVAFGLHRVLGICRSLRTIGKGEGATLKDNGSPVTELELTIEAGVRESLKEFDPHAVMVGEESGGAMSPDHVTVAVDPIDGTWAYLNHTETSATVFNVFHAGRPYLGILANPVTGEIGATRLIRLDVFGEEDEAISLPLPDAPVGTTLVNLHPAREGRRVASALLAAWGRQDIRSIRSPGGSPAWALLEAARGHFIYVNQWSKKPADPWDLAAGLLLVLGAGGDVVGLDGDTIDPLAHSGPFVAGLGAERLRLVTDIVRASLSEESE